MRLIKLVNVELPALTINAATAAAAATKSRSNSVCSHTAPALLDVHCNLSELTLSSSSTTASADSSTDVSSSNSTVQSPGDGCRPSNRSCSVRNAPQQQQQQQTTAAITVSKRKPRRAETSPLWVKYSSTTAATTATTHSLPRLLVDVHSTVDDNGDTPMASEQPPCVPGDTLLTCSCECLATPAAATIPNATAARNSNNTSLSSDGALADQGKDSDSIDLPVPPPPPPPSAGLSHSIANDLLWSMFECTLKTTRTLPHNSTAPSVLPADEQEMRNGIGVGRRTPLLSVNQCKPDITHHTLPREFTLNDLSSPTRLVRPDTLLQHPSPPDSKNPVAPNSPSRNTLSSDHNDNQSPTNSFKDELVNGVEKPAVVLNHILEAATAVVQ